MIKTRIRHKRDTLVNWSAKNPILLKGEFAIVENGNEILLKCGNGTNNFNQLPFIGADVDVSTLATKQEVADLESSLYTVINEHANNTSNPHGITKVTLNLGNVDNTADSTKTVKAAKTAESATKATQDASGNVITDTYATKVELSDTYGAATTYADQKVNGLKYAGSSTTGGAATSANKLNTDAGSATQPIYFENGVPKATSYTLGKSVPSNAIFTDTTYTLSSFGLTATATELNYCDGVTSNIQTQLNGKAASHSHNYLSLSGGTVTGTTVFSKSTDLSGTVNNSPALIIGGAATAAHIEIDPNEIQAKTNGTSVAPLYINSDGGLVTIKELTITTTLNIPGGKIWIA